MFELILVPLDGSHLAEAALGPAVAIAAQFRSKVLLVQVMPFDVMGAVAEADLSAESETQVIEERAARDYLTHLVYDLAARGIAAEARVIEGDPAAVILNVLEAEDVALLVMSTHGRGGLARVVMGSVADQVLRESRVPTLLINARTQT
jgi:nucleotide-binding universal stress UspA family protein